MAPESLLYLPVNIHKGEVENLTYAPMLPVSPSIDIGLGAYVQIATLGSLKQGLYVLDGLCWRFAMPQPILTEILIKGATVDIYLGLDTPIDVSPTATVFKNGILFNSILLEGRSIFCVIEPQSQGGTSIWLPALRDLSGHRVVKAVFGGADYASSDNAADANTVVGLTVGAAAQGQPIKIQAEGEITEPSWNWVEGPVFNGINGLLTQTEPSAGYSLIVGIAIDATTILILLKQPIILT